VFTEKELRKNPALIKAFTGMPADLFWEMIKKMEGQLPEYERQRHERAERERAIGGGRHYDQSMVIRVAGVLTYLRLHATQEAVALMYGTTQSDISRDLRRLLPLIRQVLPSPEVWQEIEDAKQLTEIDVVHFSSYLIARLSLMLLSRSFIEQVKMMCESSIIQVKKSVHVKDADCHFR